MARRKRKRVPMVLVAADIPPAQVELAPLPSTKSNIPTHINSEPSTITPPSPPLPPAVTPTSTEAMDSRTISTSISTSSHQIFLKKNPQLQPQLKKGSENSSNSGSDDDSSSGMPGIPWALPPEAEKDEVHWTTGAAVDTEEDEEEQDLDERDQESIDEGGQGTEEEELNPTDDTTSNTVSDRLSSASATALESDPDPGNQWKMHPDRQKSAAGNGGGGGRSSLSSASFSGNVGRGKRGGKSGRLINEKPQEGSETGRDENVCAPDGDGYYGPRMDVPPCTVFAPREGKIHRVMDSSGAAALVVGLDPLEKLCFVGAARVRCGRGQADVSGYTLLPVPWGPYVTAHSPRWMSLLVVRALGTEEYADSSARGGGVCTATTECQQSEEDSNIDTESEIEEAVDSISEDFPVVVVLRSLLDGPLTFLSAQADADALYSPESAATTAKRKSVKKSLRALQSSEEDMEGDEKVARTSEKTHPFEAASPASQLAAQLRLPGMQVVVTQLAGLRPFAIPQDWVEAVDAVASAPPPTGGTGLVLVCGAKGVGKSTLCRFLVNRMLGRHPKTAYMDCDLGQPEFTAPGQVSLHLLDSPVLGPPHANIRRPQLAYFIGTTTSKPEPLLYSAAVRALAEHAVAGQDQSVSFAGDDPPPPLVVNTDGWVKGMGEDLLGAVIDAVRPRHIVQILGTSTAKKFDLDRLPEGCQVHRVGAWSPHPNPVGGPPAPARPSSQDLRTLRLVAYFFRQGCHKEPQELATSSLDGAEHGTSAKGKSIRIEAGGGGGGVVGSGVGGGRVSASLRGGAVYDQKYEIASLLACQRPRQVPWNAVQIRVMNGPVPPSLVLHAINGALVGLVAIPKYPWEKVEAGAAVGGDNAARPTVGGGLVCLAETPLAPCIGLGIVRSVDVERRVLYVLTPEPVEALREVNLLVKGSLELPMVMLYDPNWCSHPYFSSEAVGGEVIKSRNYLLRRGSTG